MVPLTWAISGSFLSVTVQSDVFVSFSHPVLHYPPLRSYRSSSSSFGHCVFEPPSGRGAYGLIGKRIVDFLLVLIELFGKCYR